MSKYVVHTTQVTHNMYYVEVNDPEWAGDSIVMGELEPFAYHMGSEDVLMYEKVDKFPEQDRESVNGATYICQYTDTGEFDGFEPVVRWDLAK